MAFYMVEFYIDDQEPRDLQLPDFLSGDELVRALKHAYNLDIDLDDPSQIYLRAEDPVALIFGSKTLKEIGISNGTGIHYDSRGRGEKR